MSHEPTTPRADASSGADGAAVAGLLGPVLLDQGEGSGRARPGDVPGSAEVADGSHAGYDISFFEDEYGSVYFASRILLNGRRVIGYGASKAQAVADLEANWDVS